MKTLFVSLLFLSFSMYTLAQDGNLDDTFGVNGKVTTDIFGFTDVAHDLAYQSDGKMLVAGYSRSSVGNDNFLVVRYLENGDLDTSFGTNGYVNIDVRGFSSPKDDQATNVLIQSDNKIVLVGFSEGAFDVEQFTILRLNSDGSLDETYGDQGIRFFDFTGSYCEPADAVMLSNNNIAIAGSTDTGSFNPSLIFAIAVIDENGNLNQNFSIDGKQTLQFGANYEEAYAITETSDGSLLVGGDGANDFAVAKLSLNGNLDSTFGNNGKIITDIPNYNGLGIIGLHELSNGKIIAVGESSSSSESRNVTLIRYNSDGSLDTTFANNGFITIDIDSGSEDIPRSMFVQNDGKILIAGSIVTGGEFYFLSLRFDTDGTLDSSYSGDGVRLESFNSNQIEIAYGIKQNDNGKINIVGYSGNTSGNTADIAIAQYTGTSLNTSDYHEALISFYPNPVQSQLFINSTQAILNFSLYNLNGSLLKSKTVHNERDYKLDISDLPQGVYHLKIKSDQGIITKKVIKK
ncbi:T9SS type A sorting domain-containing protein [Psychroflexus sp. ALD_RP9]|uniref:T9SS type A sorting domain-containing protein n=1 Tax=Psychroflexus sp. ALD_RP9 TaxID=2777186 RepID=UPI001A906435|nr:T9SS type A sorting domain-containing protein [Psychroflexus sp. ALD_RP9]QSS96901.1 T9SS type A sorting domain-containing protein [Psychroflexus sp. ALD_RP9]